MKTPLRILIADNDSAERAVLTEALKRLGHEVLAAANGAEAWQALRQPEAPRLVMLARLMPEMNGPEVCRRARALENRRPPYIIMLAGKAEKAEIVAGLDAGADDYLVKPFAAWEIRARVNIGRRTLELQDALIAGENKCRKMAEQDLSERKRAEAERERLAVAIEQSEEVVVITDAQGTIQYVNPAFETVTGYTRTDAVGRNPRLLKSGEQDERFYAGLWKTIAGGDTWHGRFVNRKKHGSLYTEEATISPVRDAAGGIANYVAVKRDITEKLALEEQLDQGRKMESVGRLAGGVAHDFNNILQAILGNAQLAAEQTDPSDPVYLELEEIQTASRLAADLTRQLLAFASKQVIVPLTIDLNETVEGMLKLLRRLIGENIELIWTPRANLWPVSMDPSQIDQILANLCINARDAINGIGALHIATDNVHVDEIQAARYEEFLPGDYVLLLVSDTGCGMDKPTQARIFEPFFTTKNSGKGTGLGLSTAYGIVRQNHGHIGVYSEPGKGTTFRIHLPRHLSADSAQPADEPAKPDARGSETVLLVEDNTAVLNMIGRMLRGLGYTVLAAGTPAAALGMAEEHTGGIRLLLTDVLLPGMNGRELAERLKARNPSLKLLFMSGFTADIIARHVLLDNGIHFIQKPFALAVLAAKMRDALA